jgi:hypothetical protein
MDGLFNYSDHVVQNLNHGAAQRWARSGNTRQDHPQHQVAPCRTQSNQRTRNMQPTGATTALRSQGLMGTVYVLDPREQARAKDFPQMIKITGRNAS